MWEAYVLCLIGGVMVSIGCHNLWFDGAKLPHFLMAFVGIMLVWMGVSA